ncbi:MAG: hypothetical protein B6D59_05160 [Campylobacteraceae bacterium 4484_4]|nr:MAG: hypothetical protein B6D59_05160 [Campylobacteraceae bacterium 4484_4]
MDAPKSEKPGNEEDILYKALGALLLIKDKFADEFDDLYRKASASKEDLEQRLDQTKSRAEKEKSEIEDRLKAKIRSVIDEMGLATKEDIEELKQMIKTLKKS